MFFPKIELLRVIGRLSFPIFAYMIAEGSYYTKHKLRYFLMVFILGVICQVAYELSVIRLELIREYQNARRLKYEAMRRAERDENAETEYSSERKVDIF